MPDFFHVGDSPLRTSVEMQKEDYVSLLLEHGANKTIDSWGGPSAMTALGRAAYNLDIRIIKRLSNAKCDVSAVDGDNKRAWQRMPGMTENNHALWKMCADLLDYGKYL